MRNRQSGGSEFGAVDAAGTVSEIGAKCAKNFVVSGLAGFHEFVGDGIGVENREAEFAKHGGNGAFAAGDTAG